MLNFKSIVVSPIVKYIIISILLLTMNTHGFSQIRVKGGTRFTIGTLTKLDVTNTSGTIVIDSLGILKNNGIILSNGVNQFQEFVGFPIFGNGYEQYDTTLTGSISNFNCAGLGLILKKGSCNGTITIQRHHQPITDPLLNQGVKKYFKVEAPSLFIDSLKLTLDTTELNGNQRIHLIAAHLNNVGVYTNLGGTLQSDNYTHSKIGFDSTHIFTLMPYELTAQLLDTVFCEGDTLKVIYNNMGYGNNGVYYLEISNDVGVFTGTSFVDSSTLEYDTLMHILPSGMVGSMNYLVRVVNSSNTYISNHDSIHSLYPTPVISLNSMADTVCQNAGMQTLLYSPTGGTFNGTGVSPGGIFDPMVSGIGTHWIRYTFSNPGGCNASDSIPFFVESIPSVSLLGLESIYCSDASLDTLMLSPSGGILTGPGLADAVFDPQAVLAGFQIFTYSYTDSNGCTNSVSDTTEVLPALPTPIISQISSDLVCNQSGFNYTWYLNGIELTETTQTINTITNGGYVVQISDSNGCSVPSDTFNLLYHSIYEGLANQLAFEIYPNPAHQSITIQSNHIHEYMILNSEGKILERGMAQPSTNHLHLSVLHFDQGIYTLKITNEFGVQGFKKFVILH